MALRFIYSVIILLTFFFVIPWISQAITTPTLPRAPFYHAPWELFRVLDLRLAQCVQQENSLRIQEARLAATARCLPPLVAHIASQVSLLYLHFRVY